MLIASTTWRMPSSDTRKQWRRVWVSTPLRASMRITARSAVEAPVTMLRVYCSWPGRVGHDELAVLGREEPVGDVDGDALLALGGEAVDQEREVELAALGADLLRVGLERGEVVLEDELGVVEQPADEGGLAVVDAAAGDEAQHRLVLVLVEVGVDVRRPAGRSRCEPSRSTPPASSSPSSRCESWSITRPWRSELVVRSISWMIVGERGRLGLDGAGERVAAEGAEPHRAHLDLAGLDRHAVVVDHDQRAVALDDRPLGAAK